MKIIIMILTEAINQKSNNININRKQREFIKI